jgi:hypothetical protein
MDELTIGYVSGVLAFAVTAVQFLFPNVVVLTLSAIHIPRSLGPSSDKAWPDRNGP